MIKRLFIVFIMTFSSFAFAQNTVTMYQGSNAGGYFTSWYPNGTAACNDLWTKFKATSYGSGFAGYSYVAPNCYATTTGTYKESIGSVTSGQRCSDGSSPPGCLPPPPDCSKQDLIKATQSFTSLSQAQTTLPSQYLGCVISVISITACHQSGAGVYSCDYVVQNTGLQAPTGSSNGKSELTVTPASTTDTRVNMPPTAPSSSGTGKCPTGSVQGGSDSSGIPICIGTGTAPPGAQANNTKAVGSTATVTAADGSTTATTATTVTNKDGSVTTISDVVATAANGTKTTSQTASTGNSTAGTQGKTDSPEDKSDLCTRNPNLSICRNSNVLGSCGTITCDGDAIQCATLRATAAIQCKGVKDESDLAASSLTALGAQLLAGTDPLKSTFPTVSGATVVQAGSIDASGWLGGGSCFADKTVSVHGMSITLPFSKSCDILLALRYALMVAAALVSFKIVSGAILT